MTELKTMEISGTPPLLFLPAKSYKMGINNLFHEIKVPNKGNFFQMDQEFFKDDDVDFEIFEKTETEFRFNSHVLGKVMFASKAYPELAYNEFFVPIRITLDEANNEVKVVGQVIAMVLESVIDEETDREEVS